MALKSAGLKTLEAHREEMKRLQEDETKVRTLIVVENFRLISIGTLE